MKNFKFLLVAGLLAVSAPAFAQFANTGNAGNKAGKTTTVDTNGYSRIEVSYNPVNVTYDYDGADDLEMTGISFGYVKGFSISKSMPLYVEAGLRLTYAWNKEDESEGNLSEDGYTSKWESKTSFLGLTVPINLAYRFAIPNSEVTVTPFVGVTVKGNIIAKTETTSTHTSNEYEYNPGTYELEIVGTESKTDKSETNWFDDKDKENEPGYEAKRLQFGWNIGAGINYKSYYLGFSYGSDFSELCKKVKTNNWAISVGYSF